MMVKYLIGEKDQETISELAKFVKDDFTEEFLNIPMYNFDWIYANTRIYIGKNVNDPHKGSVVVNLANTAVEIFFRIKETVVVSNEESIYCMEITTKDAPSKDFVSIEAPEVWYKVTPQGISPVSFKEAKDCKKRFKASASNERVATTNVKEIASKLKEMKKGDTLTIIIA